MTTDDLPANLTATEAGDMIWLPYSGKSLERMLKQVRRMGWEYKTEPHGDGTLLHCTQSALNINPEESK